LGEKTNGVTVNMSEEFCFMIEVFAPGRTGRVRRKGTCVKKFPMNEGGGTYCARRQRVQRKCTQEGREGQLKKG